MRKTYQGSCHCGAVRFECELDLSDETSRCNCSSCGKGRFWKSIVQPDAFRLLEGADALSDYQFGERRIHHMFCSRCGVKTFGRVRLDDAGEFIAINVACLDDATDTELAAAPIVYQDGRHERWERAPAETSYL
jgi:hypothetical protein